MNYRICCLLLLTSSMLNSGIEDNSNQGFFSKFGAGIKEAGAVVLLPLKKCKNLFQEYGEGKQAKVQVDVQNKQIDRLLTNNENNTEFVNNQLQDIGNRVNIGNGKIDAVGGQVGVVDGKLDVVDSKVNQLAEEAKLSNRIDMAYKVVGTVSSLIVISEFCKNNIPKIRQWWRPTHQEKQAQEVAENQRQNLLILTRAEREFNTCVDDNWHDTAKDSIGIPHRCYSARDKFLAIKNNSSRF